MSANMNALIRIAARVDGANTIQAFSRDLKGLDGVAKLSSKELGRMNIAINRMAREAGNTTSGIRAHIGALENLRSRVDIGGKAYNRLGAEIDQLRGKLRGLDGDTQKAGATLKDQLVGLAATAGVGQITRGIITGAAEFDQAVRTAAAVASSGGGDFLGIYKRLRDEIQAVAAVAAGTPTEVANLAVALQRAGFSADETSQSLRQIVAGAEATGITFEEMGSITADTLRQFGIETTQTGRVVDVLVDSANSANQKVQDVGEAMKYAAPIAHSLGVTMEDTAAAVALLAESGIRGSDAGTALRTGLTRLQIAAGGADSEVATLTRGNVQLTKAMSALGSQVLDAEGKLRPLDEVIMTLKTSMDGLSMTDKSILAKALFGTEAGSKFVALMNQSSEGIRKMFADMRDAGGEAQETQQKMQGFAYAMKVLGGNVQIVTNAIGDSFIAVLGPAVGLLNGAIAASQELPKPLRDVAAAAAAAGIAIGGIAISAAALKALGVTAVLSGMVTALQGLTFAAAAAKVQMIALNAVALLNPWVALAAGITAATVALATYRSESQKVAAAAAQGDPAAIRKARQRTSQMSTELAGLVGQRGSASGRERASIDRRTSRLRQDIAREQAAIRQGQSAAAAPGRVLPVPVVDNRAGVPVAAPGGGGKSAAAAAERAAEQAAREREAAAAKIQSSAIELKNAREIFDIDEKILDARLQDNQELLLARNTQKELATVRQQVADVLSNKELPAAAKKNELDKLALRAAAAVRDMQYELAGLENKKAESAQEAINRLYDERDLLIARLAGNEAEVTLAQQLRDLTKGMADDDRARAEAAFQNVQALKQQVKAGNEMKGLYSDIGMSIKDGVVGGIQGAIDGTKSLQEVASDMLSNIANKLLDVAINMALFGVMSGTGTGGGLLGGFFKAAKGEAFAQNGIQAFAKGDIFNSPTLFKFAQGGTMRNGVMGEAGPEAIMPLRRLPGGRLGVESTTPSTNPISVVVHVDAKGTQVEGNQTEGAELGRAISAAVQAEIIKQQRPGGRLASTRR